MHHELRKRLIFCASRTQKKVDFCASLTQKKRLIFVHYELRKVDFCASKSRKGERGRRKKDGQTKYSGKNWSHFRGQFFL